METELEDLMELVKDLLKPITARGFDCYGCRYDEWDDCREGCVLVERARKLGIEIRSDEI